MTREWRLDLPYTALPLTLNPRQHGHWATRARVVREVRGVGKHLAQAHGVPRLTRATVELHWQPRDRRRRDAENAVPTSKALVDGLVDAGVLPDDTAEWFTPSMPVLHDPEPGQPGALWLVVREVTP